MTASSPSSSLPLNASAHVNKSTTRQNNNQVQQSSSSTQQAATSSYPTFNSSVAFQQVKQTQASLARLCRVHQQLQQANNNGGHHHGAVSASISSGNQQSCNNSSSLIGSQNNQSSQHQTSKPTGGIIAEQSGNQQQQQRSTSFVDCLIRRFKDCFSQDFCTVPMFVVGSLSPGSDGTHLILPPCVSLGGQNINRFSSPKNLRIMNSIRESCRSIEELDLGGNKLNDLIEVYKILQYTPNLRLLNLSENDLSRTAPVAMASNSTYPTTATAGMSTLSIASYSSSSSSSSNTTPNWTPATTATTNQRSYLAPLNQNTHTLGIRRHSTLSQSVVNSPQAPSSSTTTAQAVRARQNPSRVADARRLAAANALAQSKKTSSALASKLADSAAAASKNAAASRSHDGAKSSQFQSVPGQRNQTNPTSTMHLARSLSSLSAKDLRASNSSISRLSHRAGICNESRNSISANGARRVQTKDRRSVTAKTGDQDKASKTRQSSSRQKLFVEPIVESDDVDMSSEQQAPPNSNNATQSVAPSSTAQSSVKMICGNQTSMVQKTGINHGSSLLFSATNASSQVNSFKRTFESIKMLALNNTGCQWRVVCSILSRMPNLEELHLSLNNYEKIDLEPNEFKHHSLKRLYLCNNPKLTNWEELDKLLIAFPSLEALSIANCSISQIPDNLDRAREWRKLCGLNINGWPIKEWPVVERLNQLPSLIDLKCRNLDVLSSIDEPRHHLIARLPKLQRLNGSEIEEREDAEKAFIRFFMANSHLERPSRFHELMQIYGEISTVDVDVDLSPPSQAQVRVIYLDRSYYRKENNDDIMMSEDFLLKLMDNADSGSSMEIAAEGATRSSLGAVSGEQPVRLFKDKGQEIVALNVDLRQSVRKFKSNLATLFGLNNHNLILYYIDHEMVGLMGPELLKHNQKKLWNFNVQDGDQFIVEEL